MDKLFLKKCLNDGMPTRQIAKECGLHRNTVSYWINKYNLCDDSKFAKLPKYNFSNIDTKEKAYVLGYILADAFIDKKSCVKIGSAIGDKKIPEFISEVLGCSVRYDYTYDAQKRRFPRARIDRKIGDILKFTGGALKKDRHFPRIQKDLEKYMLLGFFDGDGCLTWGRRKDRNRIWQKVSFTSQRKILEGVQKYLLRNLNISSVVRQKCNEQCYILEFAERQNVIKFCEHIYSDKDFIILKRKYLKYKALRLELEENGESKKVS
jgi:intein/homing endonuclease